MKKALILLAFAATAAALRADVTLPAIFSDHMVLEKAAKVPVWGKADPGEEVAVTLGGQTAKAIADANGKWKAVLNLAESGPGPFEVTVKGKNEIKISDVVVGEVWVASGQSNMEWSLQKDANGAAEIAASANPLFRQFLVTKATSAEPLDNCQGTWTVASPQTAGAFSAVGYYFGKTLQNDLKVPVGLISTYWGGTPSEAWTSAEALDSVPDLKAARERIATLAREISGIKQKFAAGMAAWLKENNREDKPAADTSAYAAPGASTEGWVTVNLPGSLDAPGLPKAGAVWLRKDIDVPTVPPKLSLNLGTMDAFDTIYWNGEPIGGISYTDYPGTGFVQRGGGLEIPAAKIKQGKNTLAIRVFEPLAPAVFAGNMAAGTIALKGEWLAKAESELPALDKAKVASAPARFQAPPQPQSSPSQLFNGMINPIIPYAISGIIWYQGEANAGRAVQYRTAFPLMITDWRTKWQQGDIPFYFCQLANYMDKTDAPGDSAWAELRDAQSATLSLPNTGRAVLIDVGEAKDIHPRNKKDVGERLAKIAFAKDYGKAIPYSGPVFESAKVEDGKIRVKFTHTDGGLVAKPLPATYDLTTAAQQTAPLTRNSPNSEVEGFAICGADRKWVWADAKIDGDSIIVSSDKVAAPVAVRYAWANNPTCNLSNGAGLPASPFRTDDFPLSTTAAKF